MASKQRPYLAAFACPLFLFFASGGSSSFLGFFGLSTNVPFILATMSESFFEYCMRYKEYTKVISEKCFENYASYD